MAWSDLRGEVESIFQVLEGVLDVSSRRHTRWTSSDAHFSSHMIVGSAHDVGIRVGRRVGRDPAKVEAHRKASRESMRRLRRRRRHRMYMKLRRSAESVWAKLPWDVRLRENRLDWMRVKMRELRRTIE